MQESRVPIRLLLLKVFGMLCGLDGTVIGVLLTSVLPNELGRDIQQGLQGRGRGEQFGGGGRGARGKA